MKAKFTSKNLIGDAIWISLAWNKWYEQNKDRYDEIHLDTLNDHVTRIYAGMGVPFLWWAQSKSYDFEFDFDVSTAFLLSDQKRQHIAESYADMLGVNLDKKPDRSHLVPLYQPGIVTDIPKGLILISMFSASCSSRKGGPPNKMLPWAKWVPILRRIRQTFPNNPIRFLGAPNDRVPVGAALLVEAGEYMLGIPLDRLAHIMRESLFVVTLDNGMAHLAASQRAREFIFYPRILGQHYILPWGNKNMEFIHMEPNSLNPAQAVWALEQAWKKWGLT